MYITILIVSLSMSLFSQSGDTSAEDLLDLINGSTITPTTLRENELLFTSGGGFQDVPPAGVTITDDIDYPNVYEYILGQNTGDTHMGSLNYTGGINKTFITGKFISGHPEEGLVDWVPSANYFQGMTGLSGSVISGVASRNVTTSSDISFKLSAAGSTYTVAPYINNAYSHVQISHDLYKNILFLESTKTEARINAVSNISIDLKPINNQTLGLNTEGGSVNVFYDTLFIDSATNRVGIGTTSPEADLHVMGNIDLTGDIFGAIGDVRTFSRSSTLSKTVGGSGSAQSVPSVAGDTYFEKIYSTSNRDGTLSVTENMACLVISTFSIKKNFNGVIRAKLFWWCDLDNNGSILSNNGNNNNEWFESSMVSFDYQTGWNDEAGYLLAIKGLWINSPLSGGDNHGLYMFIDGEAMDGYDGSSNISAVEVRNFSMIMYAIPVDDDNMDQTGSNSW